MEPIWEDFSENLIVMNKNKYYIVAMDEDTPQAVAAYFLFSNPYNSTISMSMEFMSMVGVSITKMPSEKLITRILENF